MSTRSSIARITEQGEIKSIYSHSDGYPEYMEKLLTNNYSSVETIEAMFDLGDVSFLAATLDESRFYNSWRGETTQANVWSSEEMWADWAERSGIEYLYLFNGVQWFWREI
jgi:hypothetical protein